MRLLGFLLILLTAISCEPAVVFKDAMPPEVDAITTIPKQFHGVYMCESDSSRIYIERDHAVQESYYQFITSVERVRESEDCSIVAGGLYLPGRKECIPFEWINEDSITAKVYELDTLFEFADDEVMKLYRGHLFLNKYFLGWHLHLHQRKLQKHHFLPINNFGLFFVIQSKYNIVA